MNITFGFSWQGLVAFILTMIPNIGFFIVKNSKSDKEEKFGMIDIIEHALQAIFVAMLVFIVNKNDIEYNNPYMFIASVCLLIYWSAWVFYFIGLKSKTILIILAVAPVLYFIFVELWLMNYFAIIPTALFGVVHFIITTRGFSVKTEKN